jgi:Fur family transcriptional regulator, ferric uptake regulator
MIRNINKEKKISGHHMTSQRRLLLEVLRQSEGHLDAKEIYRRAGEKDSSISLATVYRSLKLFKDNGLIDEIRLGDCCCYYEIRQSKNHQHLICECCGKIVEFENEHFNKLLEDVKEKYSFKISKAHLFLEGVCPECKGKNSREGSEYGMQDNKRGKFREFRG